MKHVFQLISLLMITAMLFAFVGCFGGEQPPVDPTMYKVTYEANGGEGTAPEQKSYEAGTVITIAENTFTREGYDFAGWLCGDTLYAAGESFTVPEADTTFVAQWTEIPEPQPQPAFTQSSYEYDRIGGGSLELPIELDGAGFFYLQIDGEVLNKSYYEYDESKKVIVIFEEYVLSLPLGTITVTAITDAETEEPVSCTVIIDQSIKTTFDETTTKLFIYGIDDGVVFNVGYNGTTPVKLMQGANEVDSKYYTYDGETFTVKGEYLSLFSEATEYTLVLSNNDAYKFSVTNNIIFATDYDVVTEHNTTASNIGHNPMYQYYDNVSIVAGPEGMSGNVLKITPNTTEVTYDCNGYITLKANWWDSTWREISFTKGKYYIISFDYMTEGTSVGEFYLKGSSGTLKEDLLLGADNDGKLHHFSAIVSTDEIGNGISIRAKFIGGGGVVYIDNYKVAQLDEAPSVAESGEYAYMSGLDYSVSFNPAGLAYEVMINGTKISASYNDGKLVIPASEMAKLESGAHTLEIVTAANVLKSGVIVTDNRVSNLTETQKNVVYGEPAKLEGEFDTTLEVISLTRYGADKNWDNGGNAVAMNPKYITITADGLELAQALINQAYKTGKYVVLLSNGKEIEFELTSNIIYYSNYDETNVYVNIAGNSVICQDSSMRKFVTIEGNSMLQYTPGNATQSHSKSAINGSGTSNYFLSFVNKSLNTTLNWYPLNVSVTQTLIFTFDYDVVLGEGKESHFLFTWRDTSGTDHTTKIEGKGTFYIELPLSECVRFGVNCPVASPDMVAGSYMYVDNIGVGTVVETVYLTETSKDVTYGATESILLAGAFENGLTVTSLKRSGTNQWDTSKTAPVEMSTDYVALTANGIEIKPELINMLYGTQTFVLTLSNGDMVQFELTSNMIFYTNLDEVFVHDTSKGNISTCQDTGMRKLLDDNGNQYIRYTPENYTLSTAGNAIKGSGQSNGIFTFSNSTKNNAWWCKYALPTDSTLFITFDYEIVTGEGLDSHFRFRWVDASGASHLVELTGSGTFTIELDTNNLQAFAINCPASSPDLVAGSYMNIDNYGFGIVTE